MDCACDLTALWLSGVEVPAVALALLLSKSAEGIAPSLAILFFSLLVREYFLNY